MAGSSAATAPLPEELRPLAERLFGEHLPRAQAYADMLASQGVERGLIGPREVDRLWDRHILNCALLIDAIPADVRTLADVGSGAGLPGIVVAIARPDLEIALIETMLRRTTWLQEVVDELELGHVEVIRGRAEELKGRQFDAVTARAVAALDKLATWTLPLVAEGGHLLAMKGSSAAEEIEAAAGTLERLGGVDPQVIVVGEGESVAPTTVVSVRSTGRAATGGRPRPGGARHGRRAH